MSNIINFKAILESKRAEVNLNLLAYMPNTEPAKYTDLEWINEKFWEILKKANKNGHDIRVMQAALSIEEIRAE